MNFINMSEMDTAYYILNEKHEDMFYKDLIMEVIEKKHKPVQSLPAAISEVYTLLNMDGRFQFRGEGMWGLTEWNPPEVKHTHAAGRTAASKTARDNRRKEKLLEGIQEQ